MYALMTLIAAGVEAGVDAVSKGVGKARKRRAINKAEPVPASGNPREIRGHAVPGPDGAITAPLSGRPCVWHSVTVYERYLAWRPGPLGPTRVTRHTKVAELNSGPLYVTGDTASVRVDPKGASYDLGEPTLTEFAQRPDAAIMTRLTELLGAPPKARHQTHTQGFLIEEQTLVEGDPLHIVGQARTDQGELVISKPTRSPFIVTTA